MSPLMGDRVYLAYAPHARDAGYLLNPFTPVYFEAKNKGLRAVTKLAGRSSLEFVHPPAAARYCVGAHAPIQRHTGGMPGNIYFFSVSYMGHPLLLG